MKKQKGIIITLVAVIFILVCVCGKMMIDKNYRQVQIDDTFRSSYGNLILNMRNMTLNKDNENAIHRYNTENTKYGAFITYLVQHTSYSDNIWIDEVVAYLDQASGHDAIARLEMTDELYYKLMNFSVDFDSEETAELTYNALAEAVKY